MKGCIYYTSNNIDNRIKSAVLKQIQASGLSVTVNNTPLPKIGALSMFHQIVDALNRSDATYVFFCEHDVLYHPSHFQFTPPGDDTFYYNTNVWRWEYPGNRVTTYNHHVSLSGLCVNRELALNFFNNRLNIIYEKGYDNLPTNGNPKWARLMGYEPGKVNRDGEQATKQEWKSEFPNLDIKHKDNLTYAKLKRSAFKTVPIGWKEDEVQNLPGWDNVSSML